MSTPGTDPDEFAAPSAPCFVIDQRQRIVEWSDDASTLLSTPPNKAIGRPCFEIVQGTTERGEPVCRADCAAFSSLQDGEASAAVALVIDGKRSPKRRLRCELEALPHQQGALATLSARQSPHAAGGPSLPPKAQASEASSDLLHTLLVFAHLSTSLAAGELETSMEHALDLLRAATGADSAELFLAEPTTQDALLTAYRGPFARSFCQQMRFAPGQGFPGTVIERHAPMVSDTLPDDDRFLREEVKKRGYRAYVCVPLLVAQRTIGTLGVGARDPSFSSGDALRLLTWSSAPLAIAVQAGLMQASRSALPALPAYQDSEQDLDRFLLAVIQQARYLAGADAGTITVLGRDGTTIVRRVADGDKSGTASCCADWNGQPRSCPALDDHHGIALWGPRRRWAPPCQQFEQTGQAAYCLPMHHHGERVGLIQLVYRDVAPLPPTRHVGLLLEYAAQASAILAAVRREFEPGSRPIVPMATNNAAQSVQPPVIPDRISAPTAPVRSAPEEPFLQIHCLGPFELVRNGKPLPSRAFKRRKALTLLKILLLRAGRPTTNESLIEWLWPETDLESGTNRLHVVVHALREVVEPANARPEQLFIQNDGASYLFRQLESCWLDLPEFKSAVEKGQRAEERNDPATAIAAYDAAVELYRGDLFEDDDYAEWCLLEREYLRETYLATLQRLAALFEQDGNHDRAISHCRRIIRIDPLREATQRHLIEWLWRAGRRDEALHQYDVFASSLRSELAIDPLPETQRLAQRIRQNGTP